MPDAVKPPPEEPLTLAYAQPLAVSGPSPYAWLVVAMLFVVALLNYLDRLMIVTMHDPIVSSLHLNNTQFGLLTGVFLWVYAIVSPFGGFLGDRIGRRWVITVSLFFWSGATCLSGIAHSFSEMLIARALMGFSEACYIPAALALIADYHPGPTRSLATGLHMTGLYAGAALGGLGGFVAERFGWRIGFNVFGGIGLAYSLVILAVLRDAKRVTVGPVGRPPPLPSFAGNAGDARLEYFSDVDSPPRMASGLAALFGSSGFRVLFTINILIGLINWGVYGWMPVYLHERFHLSLTLSGLYGTAFIQAASFIGVLIAGPCADFWSRTDRRARARVAAIGYLAASPFLIATGSTGLLVVALLGLVVFGLGRGAQDANHMPVLRELVDERYSATGYGVLNSINTAVGGVMVWVGGAMKDAHVDLAHVFQFCGVAMFLAGLMFWIIPFPKAARH